MESARAEIPMQVRMRSQPFLLKKVVPSLDCRGCCCEDKREVCSLLMYFGATEVCASPLLVKLLPLLNLMLKEAVSIQKHNVAGLSGTWNPGAKYDRCLAIYDDDRYGNLLASLLAICRLVSTDPSIGMWTGLRASCEIMCTDSTAESAVKTCADVRDNLIGY